MFSEKTTVRLLRPNEVCSINTIGQINLILRQRHSKAGRIDAKALFDHVRNSRVVVAFCDDGVVGIGQLSRVSTLSYTYFAVHNLAVLRGIGKEVGIGLLDKLIKEVDGGSFIEAGVLPDDSYGIAVLTAFGFKQKAKLRFRPKPSDRFHLSNHLTMKTIGGWFSFSTICICVIIN